MFKTVNPKKIDMPAKETIILMSRGMRLMRFFKEAARDLSRDYRVIALVDDCEYKFWSDINKEVCIINFDKAFNEAVDKANSNLYELVAKIEDELSLPVFKAAGNFILYRKFLKKSSIRRERWFIDNERALLRNYVGSYLVLSKIFQENIPILIFYETADLISCRVALALSRIHNVFAVGFNPAHQVWDDKPRIWLTYGWQLKNVLLEYYYQHRYLIKQESYTNAQSLIERLKEKYVVPLGIGVYRKEVESMTRWRDFVALAILKLGYGFLTFQLKRYIKFILNALWINKHFHYDIPAEPYIAFFLQYQPEASTTCEIPRWVNQDILIEQLAINGPRGIKILVKDHARNFGYRGKEYFREFCDMFNIHLCHPAVDTHLVISKAQAILALTGTVGFEGLLMGKKVAVLGRPYYSIFEGVKKLNYPEEIFIALKDSSWKPEELEQERLVFAACYAQSLYDFGFGRGRNPWPATGGDKWAFAIRDFLKKKREFNLEPDMFDKGY